MKLKEIFDLCACQKDLPVFNTFGSGKYIPKSMLFLSVCF